jgi:enoyl-CoA hydratase/carnithine racemase
MDEAGEDIRFERRGAAAIVTLDRQKALNAITHGMVRALAARLPQWEADPQVKAVIVKAEGRAFSAGGDIMDIYRAGRAGQAPVDFFADEYRLNAAIRRFPKPFVALVDGIVMGGGVGVSFHGSHRVLGERALFAMPEVGIGFFPDVGGSFLLSRLKGGYGLYLGLTGSRIGHGDALHAGLATHAVRSADLAAVEAGIAETGDPDAVLRDLCITPDRTLDDATEVSIGLHFTMGTLGDVLASLRQVAGYDEFAAETLATLAKRSPTSLHVAFRQITYGASLTMEECMKMEFRILNRMLSGHDFYEGIRAAIVDKGDTPRWKPASLERVDEKAIDAYFEPLPGGELFD